MARVWQTSRKAWGLCGGKQDMLRVPAPCLLSVVSQPCSCGYLPPLSLRLPVVHACSRVWTGYASSVSERYCTVMHAAATRFELLEVTASHLVHAFQSCTTSSFMRSQCTAWSA